MIPRLDPAHVVTAALEAVKSVNQSTISYLSAQVPLLELKLQSNTICAIAHNLVARGISELDPAWTCREKGLAGGDLGGPDNLEVEIKTTTDGKMKGNRIKLKTGYFICIFLSKPFAARRGPGLSDGRKAVPFQLKEVRAGYIQRQDWVPVKNMQMAAIKKEVIAKLSKLYPAETAAPESTASAPAETKQGVLL